MAMDTSRVYFTQRVTACLEEASRNYHRLARLAKGLDPFVGEHTERWEDCDEEPCLPHRTILELGRKAWPDLEGG